MHPVRIFFFVTFLSFLPFRVFFFFPCIISFLIPSVLLFYRLRYHPSLVLLPGVSHLFLLYNGSAFLRHSVPSLLVSLKIVSVLLLSLSFSVSFSTTFHPSLKSSQCSPSPLALLPLCLSLQHFILLYASYLVSPLLSSPPASPVFLLSRISYFLTLLHHVSCYCCMSLHFTAAPLLSSPCRPPVLTFLPPSSPHTAPAPYTPKLPHTRGTGAPWDPHLLPLNKSVPAYLGRNASPSRSFELSHVYRAPGPALCVWERERGRERKMKRERDRQIDRQR